jgi:hypothetical protein
MYDILICLESAQSPTHLLVLESPKLRLICAPAIAVHIEHFPSHSLVSTNLFNTRESMWPAYITRVIFDAHEIRFGNPAGESSALRPIRFGDIIMFPARAAPFCRTSRPQLTVYLENATKRAPLERSAAAFDPAIKDLLATNATKQEYCTRRPHAGSNVRCQWRTLGPLFQSTAGGWVAPRESRVAKTVVPGRTDV